MEIVELNSMSIDELKACMVLNGEKAFRGEQLFTAFNKHMELDIDKIMVLPESLRQFLKENCKINTVSILKRFDSVVDSTKKYLYLLEDENIVEGVAMEYVHGITACISTQVGCKMGCEFCASTKGGLIRNLTPAEMLNQVYLMEKDLGKKISNVVLMGSGEPLDNYENTLKFINMINDKKGHNTSLRNITLSTCGVVPRIYDLAKENLPITLSISLHSPFDKERKEIMPIARRYSIVDLMEACRYYEGETHRRVSFEYTLIQGINDSMKEVIELARILKGINGHINLIPLNPIVEYNKERPTMENVERFQSELKRYNIPVTIRREKGTDISASCGQLRRSFSDEDIN